MAKTKAVETAPAGFDWDDFDSDNGLITSPIEVEEEDKDEEDEFDEDESPKFKKSKKKVEEEVEEEEKEPVKPKKAKKVEAPVEEEETPDATEEDSEEEQDPTKFFDEVDKITGQSVEVEYGEVDPISPQGVAIREKAVRENALDNFLEEIENNHPTAFKALQHAYNGGNVADLFTTITSRDYTKVEIGENDKALSTEILTEYYKSKGVKNPSKIAKLLDADEDSETGLIGEAKSALAELREEQENKTSELLEAQKQKAVEQKKKDQLLVASIDEVLDSGKLGNFKITSRQEAADFKRFISPNIRKTGDGRYEFATTIEPGKLEKLLQYEFFKFKNGDLSKLIEIKATSANAEKLTLRLKGEVKKKASGTEGGSVGKLSMKDFEV